MSNQVNNNDSDSKKIFTVLIMIFTLMVCTTGATYAYFALSATNGIATGTAATVGLDLSVTRVLPVPDSDDTSNITSWNESTKVMVPQLDDYLSSAITENQERINKCVDAKGNVVCQVYKITATNQSTASVKINGTIQFLAPMSTVEGGNTFTNLYWQKIDNATTLGSNTAIQIKNSSDTAIKSSTSVNNCVSTGDDDLIERCSKIYYLSNKTDCNATSGDGCTIDLAKANNTNNNDSVTFYILIWINEINIDQRDIDKGTWVMNVNFKDSSGNGVTSTITS